MMICLVTLLCGCGIIARGIAAGMMDSKDIPERTGQVMEGKGTLGDFDIEILEARKTKTYDDDAAVVITYRWTNHSKQTLAFEEALDATVYQDGIELEWTIEGGDKMPSDDGYVKIKPGKSFEISVVYQLRSDSPDIEVEVSEGFPYHGFIVKKSFTLK